MEEEEQQTMMSADAQQRDYFFDDPVLGYTAAATATTRYNLLGNLEMLDPLVSLAKDTYETMDMTKNIKKERKEQSDVVIRKLVNFVKSILLKRHGQSSQKFSFSSTTRTAKKDLALKIMDLGCGHGQDIYKLKSISPEFVIFVDISDQCLTEAEKRWKVNKYPFEASFIQANFCEKNLFSGMDITLAKYDPLQHKHGEKREAIIGRRIIAGEGGFVDVISCQLSAQYAFHSQKSAEQFIENISRALHKGGIFMGTVPDGKVICEKLAKGLLANNTSSSGSSSSSSSSMHIGKHYSLYSSDFSGQVASAIPYTFSMDGDDFKSREYTVIMDDLINLARKHGLHLVHRENMSMFVTNEIRNKKNTFLIDRMNIKESEITVNDIDFLETSSIFVFVKLQ